MRALSKILIAVNLAGAAASIFFFAATFFAKGLLVSKARDFAYAHSLHLLEPVIGRAEKILEDPLLSRALPRSAKLALKRELADYHLDPAIWLRRLADNAAANSTEYDLTEIKSPVARKAFEMLSEKSAKARERFKSTFDDLLSDLRIVFGANFCALVLAAYLASRPGNERHGPLLCTVSASLLVGTLLSSLVYYGDRTEWLWRILAGRYYGWSYVISLTLICSYLVLHLTDISPGPTKRSGD